MTPLRSLLREGTAPAHRRLDSLLGSYDVNVEASYAQFLCIQAAALLPLERALEKRGITSLFPDWPSRSRSAVLLRDIEALEAAPPPTSSLELPDSSEAALMGSAYVLEGSRLGAAYLLRARSRKTATGFLSHGQGESLWPSFVARLEASEDAARSPERTVAGALFAFSIFLNAAEAAAS